MKLWGGRFTEKTHPLVDEYNASIRFDFRLADEDIKGSLAHVAMLAHCAILTQDEAMRISAGLNIIRQKIKENVVEFSLSDEDIHMNIERFLYEEIGELAGKLHTGRSRNDQVALDLRLYLRKECLALMQKLYGLQTELWLKASQHLETIMPGYTHLQRAQPVLLAHHLLAYHAMFQRDLERLQDSYKRINQLPLGAGAIAGNTYPIDRVYLAQLLHFDGLCENSIDAVSDRDFIVEFLSNASLIMMHISRLSEELILWSSKEFSFIEMDDAYTTGSSMMPQKKNPDVAELARGKTGRVFGALMGLLTMLKGLPLTYNKDLQEDKEGLFDTLDTLNTTLVLFAQMIKTMQVKHDNMLNAAKQDFSNATDVADYLVKKGLTFRQAHEIIGKLVLACIQQHIYLHQLSLTQFKAYSPLFTEDVFNILKIENVVNARNVRGGTAKNQVENQMNMVQKKSLAIAAWIEEKSKI